MSRRPWASPATRSPSSTTTGSAGPWRTSSTPTAPPWSWGLLVQAVREFGLRLERFHDDSTTISFQGLYRVADGRRRRGKPTPKITLGHSKDHREDLKQLLWSLTATEDGAVPVDYRLLDGNVTDERTHRETRDVLAVLAGGPNFLYVADSKLRTKPNLLHIHERHGRFLTVLPVTLLLLW